MRFGRGIERTALIGGAFFVGAVFAITPIPHTDHVQVKTVTKTVTKEVPVEVIKTVTKEVPTTVTVYVPVPTETKTPYPQACLDAQENAYNIQIAVSNVAGTSGKQLNIASNARVAMTGGDFLDLGHVQRDQHDLEESMRGYYTELAQLYTTLKHNNQLCKDALD